MTEDVELAMERSSVSPAVKVKQDAKTIASSIGACIAVLLLGATVCYVVYRNSAGRKGGILSLYLASPSP